MIKLSIAVMHHPKRAHMLPALLDAIGAPATVITDHDSAGVWPTARRAWEAYDAEATHHLVIQDDVQLCRNFHQAAVNALTAQHRSPVTFYANRKHIETAAANGVNWAVIPDGVWGPAFCLPTQHIKPWLVWCDEYVAPSFKHDDERLAMYLLSIEEPVWCTVPSLAEHLCATESLLGQGNKNRVARRYIGDADPLEIKWSPLVAVEAPAVSLSNYVRKYGKYLLKSF